MTAGLWFQRISAAWESRWSVAFRRLTRLLVRVLVRLLVAVLRQLRLIWAGLPGRVRFGAVLVALLLIAGATESTAASLSSMAQGIAVLIVAGIGLWMVLMSPFRRW